MSPPPLTGRLHRLFSHPTSLAGSLPGSQMLSRSSFLTRLFTTTPSFRQHQGPEQRYNFYRTHGRAFFKTFTLAFLTYQICYWFWLTIEAEEERDAKDAEIKSLEGEVRLLEQGRGSHELAKRREAVGEGE